MRNEPGKTDGAIVLFNTVLFTGNANPALAQEIGSHLGIELGKAKVGGFVLAATVLVAGTAEAATGADLFSDEPAPVVTTEPVELMRVFSGITTYRQALASGAIALAGPPRLTRALPRWFAWSPFAPAVRDRLAAHPPATQGAAP